MARDCDECGGCPNCEDMSDEGYYNDCGLGDDTECHFADPGGNSALRAASATNPRNLPCPNCERPNRLTPKDVALGYQCDPCADRAESGFPFAEY